jgi:hypothetical protein
VADVKRNATVVQEPLVAAAAVLRRFAMIGGAVVARVSTGIHDSAWNADEVATALLQRLAGIALSNGIHTFTADVLAENFAMLSVLSDTGWQHTTRFEDSVLKILIDLSDLATAEQSVTSPAR